MLTKAGPALHYFAHYFAPYTTLHYTYTVQLTQRNGQKRSQEQNEDELVAGRSRDASPNSDRDRWYRYWYCTGPRFIVPSHTLLYYTVPHHMYCTNPYLTMPCHTIHWAP